jgi:hypothetical protein
MTIPTFDIDASLQRKRDDKHITGKDGTLIPLIKLLCRRRPIGNFEPKTVKKSNTFNQ